jgi:hypothetical protein
MEGKREGIPSKSSVFDAAQQTRLCQRMRLRGMLDLTDSVRIAFGQPKGAASDVMLRSRLCTYLLPIVAILDITENS